MAVPYSTDDLVARVRLEARLPDASDLDDPALLTFADDEMRTTLTEQVKTLRGEHWVAIFDTTLPVSPSTITPITIPLPPRATGEMIRGITAVDNQGNEWPMSEIDPLVGLNGVSGPINAQSYYFQDDAIIARVDAGKLIRIRYIREPAVLVPVSACAAIQSVSAPTGITLVSAWTSPPATPALVDIVKGGQPFSPSYIDLRMTGNAGTAVTLDATTPISAASFAGSDTGSRVDYLCARETSPFPPIPRVAFPALVSAVVRRVLESLGDRAGVAVAEATLAKRLKAAENIMSPRNEEGARAIVNRFSPLRSRPMGDRRWRQ